MGKVPTPNRHNLSIMDGIVSLGLCFWFFKNNTSAAIDEKSHSETFKGSGYKTILYWNPMFKNKDFTWGEGAIAGHCPVYKNCIATSSRKSQPVEDFDAVVFHAINWELNDWDLPVSRLENQKYVFVTTESPANRWINSKYDNYFNLTITYHLDSDIIWNYAQISEIKNSSAIIVPSKVPINWKTKYFGPFKKEQRREIDRLVKNKTKIASWYRSNCETKSKREHYVRELEKYVKVDKFGKCSPGNPGCQSRNCFKREIEPNYFFYLAFENSLCDDYVTEKLYNALAHYVVPVVYGGANYSHFAPPKSYINAMDFGSPKELGKYLVKLTKNLAEYKKYFEWKKIYRLQYRTPTVICELCEKLNEKEKKKTYEISQWYSKYRCPLQRNLLDKMYRIF